MASRHHAMRRLTIACLVPAARAADGLESLQQAAARGQAGAQLLLGKGA